MDAGQLFEDMSLPAMPRSIKAIVVWVWYICNLVLFLIMRFSVIHLVPSFSHRT